MMTDTYGIVGGGQLGLLLANAAIKLGIRPTILAEDASAPAARIHSDCILGSHHNDSDLKLLFSRAGTFVFENEFIDCEQFRRLSEKTGNRFFPSLDALAVLQDKLGQKNLLNQLGIPTSEFHILPELNSRKELENLLTHPTYRDGAVLKWSRQGYDGLGVLLLNGPHATPPPDWARIDAFLQAAVQRKIPVYVERKIAFKRELAILGVRSTRGEFMTYPLVISEQDSGICFRVMGPATALGVSSHLEDLARQYAQKLAEAVDLIGVFALEFFETINGELLVNEIAPRVHNTGHYSTEGCATDQFENHWRAVLGLPLGQVAPRAGFAMVNFLGPELGDATAVLAESPKWIPHPSARTHLYWYGKKEIRHRRKLGHLNGVVDTSGDLSSLVSEMEQCHEAWLSRIKSA